MIYRILGRTGFKVSQLGFGAMRLPMKGEGEKSFVDRDLAVPMIHRAFEGGVNYIDTAVGYCNSDSQRAVGDALVGWRDKVIVSTKNHYYGESESEWWKLLTDSLERLRVQKIDIYNHHGLNWKAYGESIEPRVGQWMLKARDQGLIGHICCSFHDGNEGLMKLVEAGYPASITLQYNMLDRQLEQGMALAKQHNIGVVAMGPVGGGKLGSDSPVLQKLLPSIRRVPELALRFVLANPNVSVALSGMSTMQQVEENLAAANDAVTLTQADQAAIEEQLGRLKAMANLYCTACGYCQPCEAANVAIPGIFGMYNTARVYGLWEAARAQYAGVLKNRPHWGGPADDCTECGKCEDKCPQKIPIRQQLKEAHKALTEGK
ncbi:MAG: aldo/keto reductase [Planctomycetota bacterium]|nr:aldo/keto reductase [Planctomycetota bacterium]